MCRTRIFSSFVITALTFACQSLLGTQPAITPVKIADRIYNCTVRYNNCVMIDGKDGVLLVDSGESVELGEALKVGITTVTDKPVEYLVNTHRHYDHVNGNEVFARSGAMIIAHSSVRTYLQAKPSRGDGKDLLPPIALPELCFSQDLTLFFDDEVINLIHLDTNGAHTEGDVIVFFREANVIDVGDLMFSGMYPYINNEGGWITGVVASLRKVQGMIDEKTVVVTGHGPLTNKQGLADYATMLEDVGTKVSAMMKEGWTLEEITQAKPTAAWDDKYGSSWMNGDKFTKLIYDSFKSHGL